MPSHKRRIRFWRYYKEWIETYKKRVVSQITYAKYEAVYKFFKLNFPDVYLHEVDRMQYQKMVNQFGKTHEKSTTKDFMHHVNKSLRDAVYEGWIKKDPTFNVIANSTAPIRIKRKKYLEVNETEKLMRYFLDHPSYWSYFFDFMLRTGTRFSEALGVTLEDVDFKNLTVSINKTYDYKHWQFPAKLKNKSSERIIAIDELTARNIRRAMFGVKQDDPIFVAAYTIFRKVSTINSNEHFRNTLTPDGKYFRIYNTAFKNKLVDICKNINITPITPHGLRHTHGSYMLAKGMTVDEIQRRLGHSVRETTINTYLHLLQELREQADNQTMDILNELSVL